MYFYQSLLTLRLFPDAMKKRNSLVMHLLLIVSYFHLFAFVVYQVPFFKETTVCVQDFCIPLMRTIGLSKLVLVPYDGMPVCYPPIGDMSNPIPCNSPLSIRGMLPVMLIVVIIYFQKMICSSSMYELVEQQIRSEEAKGVKRRNKLLEQIKMEYSNRQSGRY